MTSQQGTRPPRPDSLDFYTVTETAAILGVSEKLVFSWVKDEILPAIRLGPGRRLIRIRRIDLEAFVEQDFEPSTPPGHGGSLRQGRTGKHQPKDS
jgi:excisionase family DNA binding protein